MQVKNPLKAVLKRKNKTKTQMKERDDILDNLEDWTTKVDSHVEDQYVLSTWKFLFLSIISLGLYPIWWMYKEWKFFKQKDGLDIWPAMRALFSILFIFSLIHSINNYALEKNNSKYISNTYGIVFIILTLTGRLPEPYFLISIFLCLPLIPILALINQIKTEDEQINVLENKRFNGKQIVLIILGTIFWILLIIGLTQSENFNQE